MNKTKIDWVKNPDGTQGYTWNPITGCLNDCSYCFARKLANGRLKSRYLANSCLPTHDEPNHEAHHQDPFYPRLWPGMLTNMVFERWNKPRGVFVCDMSDLFGIGVPEEWTSRTIEAIKRHPESRFYLLTKQPQNLAKWSPFPPNCWVGVSATNHQTFVDAYCKLAPIGATVKFISLEPLLSWSNLPSGNEPTVGRGTYTKQILLEASMCGVSWLILGSRTQPVRHPPREWVDEIISAADKAGIPVFVKEPMASHFGINRKEFPVSTGLRG
jgi:protein gp37